MRAGFMRWIERKNLAPCLTAVSAAALAVGALLVGYEPLGGDPDCLYRPIKTELAGALADGTLPFWSDRFGLGAPLAAESHAAAFYPPNWVAYRVFSVSAAYRFMMWLHYVGLAAATFAYARALRIAPWGAALAAISFTLCGFQASHSCHEPFYHALPYLPLSLYLVERYLETGRSGWLGGLAIAVGAQVTLGHFQIQMLTIALVVLTAIVRTFQAIKTGLPRLPAALRFLGIFLGLSLAFAIALPQLGLTYQFIRFSNFDRPIFYLTYYAFPTSHWAQLVLPGLYTGFKDGANSFYWKDISTTADEATFYIGTIPLILAIIGLMKRGDRELGLWKWTGLIGFTLATMPRWSHAVFLILLRLPGLGHFRAPGRYTLLTSFALCLLAGRGFDPALESKWFRRGLVYALLFGLLGFGWSYEWSSSRHVLFLQGEALRWFHFEFAAINWALAIVLIVLWRARRVPPWLPCVVVACELGYLYYHGSTPWTPRAVDLALSPVLTKLKAEENVTRIAGEVYDVPVRVGLTVAYPNLAITPPTPNYLLESSKYPELYTSGFQILYNRLGVSHGVFEGGRMFRTAELLYYGQDKVLDTIFPSTRETHFPRTWRVERYPAPFAKARVARVVRVSEDWSYLYPSLLESENPDEVWYLAKDQPPQSKGPRASRAEVAGWSERSGTVEHDGDCDLVIQRTYFPGWTASINGGPEVPLRPADGGLQSLRLVGRGPSRIETFYRPTRLALYLTISAVSILIALGLIGSGWIPRRRVETVAT